MNERLVDSWRMFETGILIRCENATATATVNAHHEAQGSNINADALHTYHGHHDLDHSSNFNFYYKPSPPSQWLQKM